VSAPAIQARGLVKRFGDFVAVNGIDLEIPAGSCVGLLGPNGAGKTTTVEIFEGLQRQTAGEVRIFGRRWDESAAEIRERIGVQLQETHFDGRLRVEETVRLFRSFYAKGLSVEEAIRIVRLTEKTDAFMEGLSGGQKQRVALAVALVSEPELLFLDEPSSGLDPQSRRAVWEVVEWFKSTGRTVLLTTHYLEEAEALCDRVVIIDHGKIVADGTPGELIARLGGAQGATLDDVFLHITGRGLRDESPAR
jgi:ABC-2 type transport system ATP-binding protein